MFKFKTRSLSCSPSHNPVGSHHPSPPPPNGSQGAKLEMKSQIDYSEAFMFPQGKI